MRPSGGSGGRERSGSAEEEGEIKRQERAARAPAAAVAADAWVGAASAAENWHRWDGPKGDGESIGGDSSVERGGGGYSCGGGRCDDWGSYDNGSGDSRGWGAAAAQAGELEHDDQEAKGVLEKAASGEAEVVARQKTGGERKVSLDSSMLLTSAGPVQRPDHRRLISCCAMALPQRPPSS